MFTAFNNIRRLYTIRKQLKKRQIDFLSYANYSSVQSLLPGVTDIIKFLFPPVPYPDFVPVMVDFSGYKLDTADVPDWSVIYRTVAQPLETAIVTVYSYKL